MKNIWFHMSILAFLILAPAVAKMMIASAPTSYEKEVDVPYEQPEFTSFDLSRNGMALFPNYVVKQEEDGYYLTISYLRDEYGPIKLSNKEISELNRLYTGYDMKSWDGFVGENSNMVDGEGFYLYLILTDGTMIQARGENEFPEGYFEMTQELDEMFYRKYVNE